jgi:hypothetical protein
MTDISTTKQCNNKNIQENINNENNEIINNEEFNTHCNEMWKKCINNWKKYKKQYINLYGLDNYNLYYTSPIIYPDDDDL